MSMPKKSEVIDYNAVLKIGRRVRVAPYFLNAAHQYAHVDVFKTGIITYINRNHQYFTVRIPYKSNRYQGHHREAYKYCDIGQKVLL